jgi:hypothetical protein
MNHAVTTRNVRLFTLIAFSLSFLCGVSAVAHSQAASSVRTVSGVVEDKAHEPLRGAVVEVQNPASNSVQSFITDASGHYSFKRLDGNTDYRIWATFRGHKSSVSSISKFDSHLAKTLNFTLETN